MQPRPTPNLHRCGGEAAGQVLRHQGILAELYSAVVPGNALLCIRNAWTTILLSVQPGKKVVLSRPVLCLYVSHLWQDVWGDESANECLPEAV